MTSACKSHHLHPQITNTAQTLSVEPFGEAWMLCWANPGILIQDNQISQLLDIPYDTKLQFNNSWTVASNCPNNLCKDSKLE